jgi:cellulose biosynthesis protein BcsQ
VNILGRLKLVIFDGDKGYLADFKKFLVINYPQRFDIFTFSSPERMREFLSGKVQIDILVINSRLYEENLCPGQQGIVLLCGDEDGPLPEGVAFVNKYQHMDRLVAEITRLYTAKSLKECNITGPGNTRIISVYSPSGGTGKSCIAAGCSMLCAGRGAKAFYLNLESIPSTDLFFHSDCGQSFSNVIFHLKGKGGNLSLKLESAKSIDGITGVHFFKAPGNAYEMSELSEQDIELLLGEFRRNGVYDTVFIDMPSGLSPNNITVLKYSDTVISVLSPDLRSSVKLKRLKTSLDLIEFRLGIGLASRIVPVLNKVADSAGYAWENNGLEEFGPVSVIRDCGCARLNSPADITSNVNFMSDLNNVLRHILPHQADRVTAYGGGGGSVA